jgi:hypothetical protein
MLVIGLVSWWYGAGWLQLAQRLLKRVTSVTDFFSMSLLLRTLFSPYRQISVGRVQGPVGVQLRAWFDLQISRVIGAMIRLIVVIFGLAATIITLICALAIIFMWPLIPILPLLGLFIVIGRPA